MGGAEFYNAQDLLVLQNIAWKSVTNASLLYVELQPRVGSDYPMVTKKVPDKAEWNRSTWVY